MINSKAVCTLLYRQRAFFATRSPPAAQSLMKSVIQTFSSSTPELSVHNGTKHCPTCDCPSAEHSRIHSEELPPPLPEPQYSVLRRVLPANLIGLSSPQGRKRLVDALSTGTAESYWSLTEHFVNQSDPAFCGATTLLLVLNSLLVDPQVRWRGGWRYFGDEDVLLGRCCFSRERIRRIGIDMEEFKQLARCQGLVVDMKRPNCYSLDEFRQDITQLFAPETEKSTVMVVSFSRETLQQTGSGHFSPIAAYHAATDSVLILDVARFKYPPYWASVEEVYDSMVPIDESSHKCRGWFLLDPPTVSASYYGTFSDEEHRRPAHLVAQTGDSDVCPVGPVKVQFCKAAKRRFDDLIG